MHTCIYLRQVIIRGTAIHLVEDALSSARINDCGDDESCGDIGACLNGGTCVTSGTFTSTCVCADAFSGDFYLGIIKPVNIFRKRQQATINLSFICRVFMRSLRWWQVWVVNWIRGCVWGGHVITMASVCLLLVELTSVTVHSDSLTATVKLVRKSFRFLCFAVHLSNDLNLF